MGDVSPHSVCPALHGVLSSRQEDVWGLFSAEQSFDSLSGRGKVCYFPHHDNPVRVWPPPLPESLGKGMSSHPERNIVNRRTPECPLFL